MTSGITRVRHFSLYRGSWPWLRFSPAELADFETGELVVVPSFLDWLEFVRVAFNRPIIVNDGTRSTARQQRKNGKSTGAHPDGMAIDARVAGEDAYDLAKIALAHDVMGLGVYQSTNRSYDKRFLHLDMWTKAPPGFRPMIWSG